MKKFSLILCLLLIVALAFSLSACAKDGKDGKDGVTPTIEISDDGYWVINGEKTNVKASSEAGIDENPQGLQFYKQDDGTYIVSCGDAKYLSSIVIPATYKGGAVVAIDYQAFSSCSKLTSVTIPDSVTSIGSSAFSGCDSLTSVTIPDSVTSIGAGAFSSCSKLTSVTIPDSVTTIGNNAFYYCSSLTSVAIPNSVTSIGAGAFWYCTSLTSVTIPDSVTSIGEKAFSNCTSLTSVTIGNSVTSIGSHAFSGCLGLVYNEYDNASYLGNDSNPYFVLVKPKDTSITNLIINENTKFIYSEAFSSCINLTSVTIPDSVTSIGNYAFRHCYNLTSINFEGTVEQWNTIYFGSDWKHDIPATTEVVCSDGTVPLT